MVGAGGFEPTTSSSQSWRSTRLNYTPKLLNDIPMYRFVAFKCYGSNSSPSIRIEHTTLSTTATVALMRRPCFLKMVRPERFELPTTKFVAWYSIQLSYGRTL